MWGVVCGVWVVSSRIPPTKRREFAAGHGKRTLKSLKSLKVFKSFLKSLKVFRVRNCKKKNYLRDVLFIILINPCGSGAGALLEMESENPGRVRVGKEFKDDFYGRAGLNWGVWE